MKKFVCAVLAMTSCATMAMAQDAATPAPATEPVPVVTAAPAADAATTAPVATQAGVKVADMFDPAPADKGQIIFYRPGGMGALIGCMVREGEGTSERHLSKLTGNRYFVEIAEPGKHEYWVKSEATDKLPIEIEAGETYFVRCKINMGLMVGRPNISPSTEVEFTKYKPKLKLMAKEDMAEDNADTAAKTDAAK